MSGADRRVTHGHTRGGHSPTYRSWHNMVSRCTNENVPEYPWYGGRGIFVCERWRSFENFLADMGERPPGTSIDRFPDMNGDYEPGNCRWATRKEQSRNTTRSKLTLDTAQEILGRLEVGEPIPSIAMRLGVNARTVYDVKDGNTWRDLDRPPGLDKRSVARYRRRPRRRSRRIACETAP